MPFVHWRLHRKQVSATLAQQIEQTVPDGTGKQPETTRRYLEKSDYLLPKDQGEEDRLNFQHHALYQAIGSHYVAPISKNIRLMLDVGTGTGIWPIEMARLFSQAQIIGIDVDPSLFKASVPENCYLRIGDLLTRLPFPDALFGYTHQRLLTAAITAGKWQGVVRELIRVTCPGGWVELVEIDDRMQNIGPAGQRLQMFVASVGKSMGFDGEVVRHLGDMLREEGLQSVEVQPILIPIGEWGGRAGSMMRQDLLTVLETMKPIYCQKGNLSDGDFEQMIQATAVEWEAYRSYCTFFVAYGKRRKL